MADFVVGAFLTLAACGAQLEPRPARAADVKPDLAVLSRRIEKWVEKHYPDAKCYLSCNERAIRIEHNIRLFMIHHPDKFGEYQDASEELGPQKGGILCDIELREGKYSGAAAVPQEIDEKYFTVYLAAPYSKSLDLHLYVRLKYPKDASKDFLKEFELLVNGFEKSVRPRMCW